MLLIRLHGTAVDSYVALLHARTSPSGNKRLVAVQAYSSIGSSPDESDPRYDEGKSQQFLNFTFSCDVRSPASLFRPPSKTRGTFASIDAGLGSSVKLFCGQPDPDDASHFTFRYKVDGAAGTIDAWLQDDDTIKFQVRDGPAKGSG